MTTFSRLFVPVLCSIAAMATAVPAQAAGYRVAPMIYDLAPSGKDAATLLRVQNDSDKPITVELVAEKRAFDEKGGETRSPADDDFMLFPPQAVVAAGATQAVRVQYVGTPALDRSVTYTITVKQVPVALPADGATGVQFMFNFSTLANIVPPRAQPAIAVVSLTAPGGAAGGYQLRLRNDGTKYANLATARITVASDSQSYTLTADEWRKAMGSSWLLPGNDRVYDLPAGLPLPKGATRATIVMPATGN